MLKENSVIKNINPLARLIILLILIFSLLVAKSIYLILLITTILLLICAITNENVKTYVKFLKKVYFILLILLVAYIIIIREFDLLKILLASYKIIVASLMIKVFEINTSFSEVHESIYGMLYIFRKLNIEKFSLDTTLSLYFIKFWFDSKEEIINIQKENGRKVLNIKYFLFPRLIWSINRFNKLQTNLKLSFYKIKYKSLNKLSKRVLLIFVIFFIICIFKEVIL